MKKSGALMEKAGELRMEFWRYAQAARPPENPVYDYDLSFPCGAQLMAARLGYRIFPATVENIKERLRTTYCPEASHAFVTKSWCGENRSCPIMAALGPSHMTVVEIADARSIDAFVNLARHEDIFGSLPRTRIVQTPTGYQIHMRGVTHAAYDSLGVGLELKSLYRGVFLPGSNFGEEGFFRWLRVGDLRDAPEWVLDRRVNPVQKAGAEK